MAINAATIVGLLDVINAAAPAPEQGSDGADGFQSLLNISSQNITPAAKDNNASSTQDFTPAAITLPQGLFTAPQPQAQNQPSGLKQQSVAADQQNQPAQSQNDPAPANNQNQPASPASAPRTAKNADDTAATGSKQAPKDADASSDTPAPKRKLTQDDVAAALADIMQILQALLPAAAPVAPAAAPVQTNTAPASSDTDATAVDTATTPAAPSAADLLNELVALLSGQAPAADASADASVTQALASLTQQQGAAAVSAPAGATADASAAAPQAAAQPADLLKDIQSLLTQLQQLLPVQTDGQTTDTAQAMPQTTDAGAAQTVDITSALPLLSGIADDLQQLLPQLAQAPVSTASAKSAPQTEPVTTLVQNSLSLLQTMLPPKSAQDKMQPAVTATPVQNVSAPQPAQLNAAPVLLFPETAAKPAKPANDPAPAPAVAAPAAPAVSTDTTPQPPQSVTVAAAPVAQGSLANDGGSMNSNSGQGGSNAFQPMGVAAATNQTQQAAATSAASFANALSDAAKMQNSTVMEQVTFNVRSALLDGSSKIHIQLDPADLGKLDIKLNVGADGKTGVVITADNKSTLDLLQKDAANLARALSDAGLKADTGSLNFNLRDQQQGSQQQAAATYQKAAPDDEAELPENVINRSYVVNLNEGLDIRI